MTGAPLPFPLLVDETGEIGRLYDVYNQNTGKTLRGTFIIDHQGLIHGMELLTNSIGRCPDEILRQLKAFQNYVSTGEMAPCNWQPGDKTIKESLEASGHIWQQWKPQ